MRARFHAYAIAITLVAFAGAGCGEGDDPAQPSDRSLRITAQPDTSIAYGDTLHLTVSAWDPDGDALTYSVAIMASLSEIRSGYFAFHRINPQTGAFWFYPNSRDIPKRSMQFGVTDEDGNSDTTTFTVNVTTVGASEPSHP